MPATYPPQPTIDQQPAPAARMDPLNPPADKTSEDPLRLRGGCGISFCNPCAIKILGFGFSCPRPCNIECCCITCGQKGI
ncbi:hypothetical protein Q8F55_004746 [Vanrija albida]|uniref:Uncharacterized protein n=1 Tax=Vanrija albida TaxID=181172 RepID=A0ABR3PZM4_9TREE